MEVADAEPPGTGSFAPVTEDPVGPAEYAESVMDAGDNLARPELGPVPEGDIADGLMDEFEPDKPVEAGQDPTASEVPLPVPFGFGTVPEMD